MADTTPATKPADAAAKLPVAFYGNGTSGTVDIPAGWMGNTGATAMDDKCAVQPHTAGSTCIKCDHKAANNWGNQPGGQNLTGATKLTSWVRG